MGCLVEAEYTVTILYMGYRLARGSVQFGPEKARVPVSQLFADSVSNYSSVFNEILLLETPNSNTNIVSINI